MGPETQGHKAQPGAFERVRIRDMKKPKGLSLYLLGRTVPFPHNKTCVHEFRTCSARHQTMGIPSKPGALIYNFSSHQTGLDERLDVGKGNRGRLMPRLLEFWVDLCRVCRRAGWVWLGMGS